jgi:hypothetical protein
LAVGKAPVINFMPLADIISAESEKFSSPETMAINQVAEPVENYLSNGK